MGLTRVGQYVRSSAAAFARACARLVGLLATEIGVDGALLACGLLLLSYGSSLVYPPAGFIVPGVVLTWNWLPTRPPFVARPPHRPPKEST